MKKPYQALLAVALVTPIIAGLLWFGASGTDRSHQVTAGLPSSKVSIESAFATPSTSQSVIQTAQAVQPALETPVKKPINLTPEERRFILGEFVKAAEKDIAQAETGLAEAKAQGAVGEDIASRQEKLNTMKQMLQRTLERNTGV